MNNDNDNKLNNTINENLIQSWMEATRENHQLKKKRIRIQRR